MRTLSFVAGLSNCLILFCSAHLNAAGPNVLLILTDDQGYGDIRSHGNPYVDTPTLDRLAAEGVRFDRFFVSPVCAPTRASLLTGRWHLRTGVHGVTRSQETMRSTETTLAEVLKSAGYATGIFGKWHNGAHFPHHPNGQGFDQFVGFCAGHWNNYFDGTWERNGREESFDGFIIDRLTDEAINFIKTNQDRPWFCYVPFNTPHSPWQVPDSFWQKYLEKQLGDAKATCAYAMVENIDANVGRLLQVLQTEGLEQNTVVIFLTDNGANSQRFNSGMRGRKGSLHEGGSRVPCFVRWLGHLPKERIIPQVAAHIDLLPTIVELTGAELPSASSLDGVSLVPLLNGQNTEWPRRQLFTHWGNGRDGTPDPNRGAVRTDRWRAVRHGKRWELYDMLSDPSQLNDVAAGHPQVVRDLSASFSAWYQDVTQNGFDPIPTEIGHPESPSVTLPAHEAFLVNESKSIGITYHGRAGWANDWITNWRRKDAYPEWPVKIVAEGLYRIELQCSVPPEAIGNQIELRVAGRSASTNLTQTMNAVDIPCPDRVPRIEAYEKKWPRLLLTEIDLPAGSTRLTLHAVKPIENRFIDVKAVRLVRIDRGSDTSRTTQP